LLAAFVLLLAVTPAISSASRPKSGLHGSVRRGPTQPVCSAEEPCNAPVVGAQLTFVRGSVVRHVRTKAGGRYSMRLKPGRYSVRVAGAPFGYSPSTVVVRRGRMSTMNILIDTGIR
jgi:hypothetical protein